MAINSDDLQMTRQAPIPNSPGKKRSRNRKRRGKRTTTTNGNSSDSSGESKRTVAHRRRGQATTVSLHEQAQYVAMDCEMVGVMGPRGGQKSALARVTMVNWNHDVVYDAFVRPDEPVVDYRTFVSGITADDLVDENVTDFGTCRQAVLDVLKDKVLVGHALKNDLQALNIKHPWQMVRDTAKYEPFMKIRFDNGILWPRKLKELVSEKLNLTIQTPGLPHSAFEDAVAALDLYKYARGKWEKVMAYKILKTASMMEQNQSSPPPSPIDAPVKVDCCMSPTTTMFLPTLTVE